MASMTIPMPDDHEFIMAVLVEKKEDGSDHIVFVMHPNWVSASDGLKKFIIGKVKHNLDAMIAQMDGEDTADIEIYRMDEDGERQPLDG